MATGVPAAVRSVSVEPLLGARQAETLGVDNPPSKLPDPSHLHDDLQTEYFKLVDLVTAFDQRLVTIKGWGVTLSLASLGVGFQQSHYGRFLVATVSAVAFWVVEGSTKLHQMQHYPRMREIEVAAFNLYRADTKDGPVSSPLLDWSWDTAGSRPMGSRAKGTLIDRQVGPPTEAGSDSAPSFSHMLSFLMSSRSPLGRSYS